MSHSKARRISLFVLGAAASAVIGAVVLAAPSWIQERKSQYTERRLYSRTFLEIRALESFAAKHIPAVHQAIDIRDGLPAVPTGAIDFPYEKRVEQFPKYFEAEAEIKGAYFSVWPACSAIVKRIQAIRDYKSNLPDHERASNLRTAERNFDTSVCHELNDPVYHWIIGTENDWRQRVVPLSETTGLPKDAREKIASFQNRCTISEFNYSDKPCGYYD